MSDDPGAPGKVLDGKFRLESCLGRGGMGSVWRAEHLTLRAPVAIKLVDPDFAKNEEAMGRFLREAQSAAALRSPHVVQILDYGVDAGVPFIAMEMLEGESLGARLVRLGRLSTDETVRVVTHIARAMQKAHDARIVHRDLKPENVFLVRNEDDEIAKVLDFGIAKTQSGGLGHTTGGKTRTGSLLGTPYYMSPEQAQGTKTVDWRTDLWALGIIAYECMTGKRPFNSEAIGDLLLQICVAPIPVPSATSGVPPAFDGWFARAANRDVDQRFQSAREMADSLRECLAGGGAALSALGPGAVVDGHAAVAQTITSANTGEPASLTVGQFGTSSVATGTRSGRGGLFALLAAFGVIAIGVGALVVARVFSSGGATAASSGAEDKATMAPAPLAPAAEPARAPPPVVEPVTEPAPAAPSAKPASETPPTRQPSRPPIDRSSPKPEAKPAPAPKPKPDSTPKPGFDPGF